nr:receptor-type tyrosine-protein phosphatase N2 isoform X2 [Onthophagus taurus]
MPWPDTPLTFILLLLGVILTPHYTKAEGYVGCLFSESLCLEEIEFCYDDNVFGRCLPETGNIEEDELFRHDLTKETLHKLSTELKRLFALGYRWSHTYTQCRLQGMLYSIQNELPFEPDLCYKLVDQDLEGALRALEGEDEPDPDQIAIVRFSPSKNDPFGRYADEVYYPPVSNEQMETRKEILPDNIEDLYDMEDPLANFDIDKRSQLTQIFTEDYNTPKNFRLGKETRDIFDPNQFESKNNVELAEFYPIIDYLTQLQDVTERFKTLPTSAKFKTLSKLSQDFDNIESPKDINVDEFFDQNVPMEIDSFQSEFNAQNGQNRDEIPESRVYYDEDEDNGKEYGSGELFKTVKGLKNVGNDHHRDVFRELKQLQEEDFIGNNRKNNKEAGLYTEGGVVYDSKMDFETPKNEDFSDLMSEYTSSFKRPERLDVKKPGPRFDLPQNTPQIDTIDENFNVVKKEPRGAHPNPSHDILNVDTDYVYVTFKQKIENWRKGEEVISNISKVLKLENGVLGDGRVGVNEVTFKVMANKHNLNASEVAKRLGVLIDDVKAKTGLDVIGLGVGDKVKMGSVIINRNEKLAQFYVILFTICGILAALIIGSIILIIIKKHIVSKQKLDSLTRPDTEASKDYQDLCRARMATKQQQQPETAAHGGRVTSLSKESEQSPSSRSSTSSWSEEPALHNMDISTGHMVLTYMEDHLRNKDRLEQEWIALCAYLAEPSECKLALNKDNCEKNRYPEILPYDHARVVLNKLSNENGSDYINASSITDHDPRNPAYIATQGPLPHTAPDFWQLIWEQGAVVIVMLTRLTEGGAAMCHRYWPEEGSELYHIYEVHLVSEHIWCDDYLVRSFYLKNVRTGETRTVTQFHFLSWPESGVPSSTKALLEFRRKVNKSYRGRSCPIVVHCSDGAGRTGTYCLIDMVLSRMAKGAKEIDIAATLEHLRDQRPKMVATKQQFEFVLTAVAEEVHAILKALPPAPIQEKEKDKEVK